MGILSINTNTTGLVGYTIEPRRVTMVTTDNLATITTAGYLNNFNKSGFAILPTDVLDVLYSFNQTTKLGTFGIFQPVFSGVAGSQTITLNAWENPGNVLLPVVSGHIAVFNGTTGQIYDNEYVPSDPTFPTVIMGVGSYTAGNVARFADTAGTLANSSIVATDIQVKSGVIVTKTANVGGFGAGPFDVTVTGMTAASVVVCSVEQSSNSCFVKSAVPGTGKFVITFSADPGATCIVSYIAYLVSQHP